MCIFVTLIVRGGNADRMNAVLAGKDGRGRRRRAERISSACLQELLAEDENEFWLVDPPCDCGTLLGSALASGPSPEDRRRSAANRYRRKGWSAAKIARALSESERASVREHRHHRPKENAGYWSDLMSDVARALSLPSVGLMHHFYARAPGTEEFIAARQKAGLIRSASDTLARMQDGVIYDFAYDV